MNHFYLPLTETVRLLQVSNSNDSYFSFPPQIISANNFALFTAFTSQNYFRYRSIYFYAFNNIFSRDEKWVFTNNFEIVIS